MKKMKHPFWKFTLFVMSSALLSGCCAMCPECCDLTSMYNMETETLQALSPAATNSIELADSLNQSPVIQFDHNQSFLQSEILTANDQDNEESNSVLITNKQGRSRI